MLLWILTGVLLIPQYWNIYILSILMYCYITINSFKTSSIYFRTLSIHHGHPLWKWRHEDFWNFTPKTTNSWNWPICENIILWYIILWFSIDKAWCIIFLPTHISEWSLSNNTGAGGFPDERVDIFRPPPSRGVWIFPPTPMAMKLYWPPPMNYSNARAFSLKRVEIFCPSLRGVDNFCPPTLKGPKMHGPSPNPPTPLSLIKWWPLMHLSRRIWRNICRIRCKKVWGQ